MSEIVETIEPEEVSMILPDVAKTYHICLQGCDDRTDIVVNLTERMALSLRSLAIMINQTSSFCCMPRMYVEQISEDVASQMLQDGSY